MTIFMVTVMNVSNLINPNSFGIHYNVHIPPYSHSNLFEELDF